MSTLGGLIDVRPDERRNAFAAFAALLSITTAHTLLEMARDALFLSKLPAGQLPWMYLVIVVLALALARLRAPTGRGVIASSLVVGATLTACFWVLVADIASRPWVLYALYVWTGLFSSWVTVQLWTLLGRVHTIAQAKRIYGFIGAGAVLGGALGAFASRAALAFVSPRATLLLSSTLFVVAVLPVVTIRVTDPQADVVDVNTRRSPSMATGASLLWSNVFARRVLGIALLATVAVTLADFLFKARFAAAYPDAQTLAARLSIFHAIVNSLALVAQLALGPWIFREVGVRRALFFFPFLLLVGATGVIATGGMIGAAILLKGVDGSLRYSVHKTSMELLLVPVPDGTRERIKPIVELAGTRGGQALASVIILTLVAAGCASMSVVGGLIVLVTVLWAALVVSIRGHYLDVFRETLRAGGLSGEVALPALDLGALETLFAALNSDRDSEVIASLELLADQRRAQLIPALILYHPSRDVVLRALQLFAELGRKDFVPIADRLNGHPDREVAAAALRARTAVAPDRELLEARLDDGCPEVSMTALIALMGRGWITDADAEERVQELLASRWWPSAVAAARAIRDVGEESRVAAGERFDALLIRLARDAGSFGVHPCSESESRASLPSARPSAGGGEGASPPILVTSASYEPLAVAPETRVSLEVVRAMTVRKNPAFLPILVGMLNRHELRASARAAIAGIAGAFEYVDEVLLRGELPRDVRVHLPRTLALFEPTVAARKLVTRLLTEKDGAVRFKVLRALVKLRRDDPKLALDQDELRRVIETTLDHSEELRRWGALLSGATEVTGGDGVRGARASGAGHHLLVDLIRDKQRHARQRLFMLLELVYGEDFETIERGLRSAKPKTRASSLELVENLVRPPLRARVLALVADDDPSPWVGRVDPLPSYEAVLGEIIERGGDTMRTLAEYRALELGMDVARLVGATTRPVMPLDSLGKRLVTRGRDALSSGTSRIDDSGATRAPA